MASAPVELEFHRSFKNHQRNGKIGILADVELEPASLTFPGQINAVGPERPYGGVGFSQRSTLTVPVTATFKKDGHRIEFPVGSEIFMYKDMARNLTRFLLIYKSEYPILAPEEPAENNNNSNTNNNNSNTNNNNSNSNNEDPGAVTYGGGRRRKQRRTNRKQRKQRTQRKQRR